MVQAQGIVTTFGVDWSHLLAQIASFCIVCFILYRFAYRPVLKMLEVRRQQIALGQAKAERIEAELARIEAQRQEVLAQANAQANTFIEEARAAAARVRTQETQKAASVWCTACSMRTVSGAWCNALSLAVTVIIGPSFRTSSGW